MDGQNSGSQADGVLETVPAVRVGRATSKPGGTEPAHPQPDDNGTGAGSNPTATVTAARTSTGGASAAASPKKLLSPFAAASGPPPTASGKPSEATDGTSMPASQPGTAVRAREAYSARMDSMQPPPFAMGIQRSSSISVANGHMHGPPMGPVPPHYGYAPFLWTAGSLQQWPPEPSSPHPAPSPLMGSPVSTPTASYMFPQTPFAGAHHSPFSQFPNGFPSPGHPAHYAAGEAMSPQGSGHYGWHPLWQHTFPPFMGLQSMPSMPGPPPRTSSISVPPTPGAGPGGGAGGPGPGGMPVPPGGPIPRGLSTRLPSDAMWVPNMPPPPQTPGAGGHWLDREPSYSSIMALGILEGMVSLNTPQAQGQSNGQGGGGRGEGGRGDPGAPRMLHTQGSGLLGGMAPYALARQFSGTQYGLEALAAQQQQYYGTGGNMKGPGGMGAGATGGNRSGDGSAQGGANNTAGDGKGPNGVGGRRPPPLQLYSNSPSPPPMAAQQGGGAPQQGPQGPGMLPGMNFGQYDPSAFWMDPAMYSALAMQGMNMGLDPAAAAAAVAAAMNAPPPPAGSNPSAGGPAARRGKQGGQNQGGPGNQAGSARFAAERAHSGGFAPGGGPPGSLPPFLPPFPGGLGDAPGLHPYSLELAHLHMMMQGHMMGMLPGMLPPGMRLGPLGFMPAPPPPGRPGKYGPGMGPGMFPGLYGPGGPQGGRHNRGQGLQGHNSGGEQGGKGGSGPMAASQGSGGRGTASTAGSMGGAGSGPQAGQGTPGGGGAAGSTPRLNARQRRTLRRAKERAIKGLMEAGHLLIMRTGTGSSAGSPGGEQASGGDNEQGSGATDGLTAELVAQYLSAAIQVAGGSHGPQAAADASQALSKVAADLSVLEDMDLGQLIAQLSSKREEGVVDESLIRDLQIIQNLVGAFKLSVPAGAGAGGPSTKGSPGGSPPQSSSEQRITIVAAAPAGPEGVAQAAAGKQQANDTPMEGSSGGSSPQAPPVLSADATATVFEAQLPVTKPGAASAGSQGGKKPQQQQQGSGAPSNVEVAA